MRKGMLEANKRYFIRRKNDKSVLIEMNRTSAMISNFWRYDSLVAEINGEEGTPMTLSATVPRIAGNDYLVDHGGEMVETVVKVPHGKAVEFYEEFRYNPQSCEYTITDALELVECM